METMKTKHDDNSRATDAKCIKYNTSECKQTIVESIAKNRDAAKTVYNAFLELHGLYNPLLEAYSDVKTDTVRC